ncbi:MAG: hypothetical protein L3J39_07035 [Verrucomicrobiales bacterium]|nr:hypothetical protein [Verrucomicrobiales bacterium]
MKLMTSLNSWTLFAKGGHGFGMKKTTDRVAAWPQLCAEWLGELGLVNE